MADLSVLRRPPNNSAAWLSPPVLIGSAVVLACFLVAHARFLFASDRYFHDSITGVTLIGLFYDRLFSQSSWLWSSDLNAGHPLWMVFETAPFFDPVALLVYPICRALGTDWFLPYQISAIAWLLIFSLGGAMCAKQLIRSPWASVLTLLLLLGGPLAILNPAQSWGFILPFRYFPWVVWAYLRLRSHVSMANVLTLSAISSLALSGYQSAYSVFVMMFIVFSEAIIYKGRYVQWLGQVFRWRYLLPLALPLLAALPTLAYVQYSSHLVVVPRIYDSELVYFFSGEQFFSDLFFLIPSLFKENFDFNAWHGTTYLGLLAPLLLIHGLQRTLRDRLFAKSRHREGDVPAILFIAFLITTVITCGSFGLKDVVVASGSLLGVRNFGFMLTASVLLLTLLAAQGFQIILERGYTLSDVIIDSILFVCLALVYLWLVGLEDAPPSSLALAIAVFVGASLLIYLLRRLGPSQGTIAATVIVLMTAETLVTTHAAMWSLDSFVTRRGIGRDVAQALKEIPRLGQTDERFHLYRPLGYPVSESWPIVLSAPAVRKQPTALMSLLYPRSQGAGGVTHLFRTRAYEDLVSAPLEPALSAAVLGVTRPVLELVPRSALADDEVDGMTFVLGNPVTERAGSVQAGETRPVLPWSFSGDRLVADVATAVDSVLVYRDNMAPGWSATLNGEDTNLLVVDRINKAVAVPPGEHRVEFVYRPWPYLVTFALRALAMLAALTVCAWLAVRAYRKPRAR
jgi:hypothetical protein